MSRQSSTHAKPGNAPGLTRSNASLLQRQSTLGTHVCVQREAVGATTEAPAPSLVREVMESPGRPLDSTTRSAMEPRFGFDFSHVRVHTDEEAAESARAINANAYTAGEHVVFGEGKYAPGVPSGEGLIAHELTHVVQQASGPVEGTPVADGLSVSHPSDKFEQAARRGDAGPGANGEVSHSASLRSSASAQAGPIMVQRDGPLNDTSGSGPFQDEQAKAAKTSAGAGIASAIAGGVSALAGVVSAYESIRSANFAERSAKAAEDPPVAEPTTGGVTSTHVDVPEIKALDKKSLKDKQKALADQEKTEADNAKAASTAKKGVTGKGKPDAEQEKPKPEEKAPEPDDVGDTTVTKETIKEQSKTKGGVKTTTKETEKTVLKGADDTDHEKVFKVLRLEQGKDNSAEFLLTLRTNDKDISGGSTEDGEISGYLGGSNESNASVAFRASAGEHLGDGAATVRLLYGGTNVSPRKRQTGGSFGSGGFQAAGDYSFQRFSGSLKFTAKGELQAPSLPRVTTSKGVATPKVDPSADATKPAVTISLDPSGAVGIVKKEEKKK